MENICKYKYEDYLDYMSRYDNGSGFEWITLNSQGWTKLIHDMLDERILADFNLSPVKERCWARAYDNGRRPVISMFPVNDMYATFEWGWNFEYIPRISGNKCVWARTDKSIYAHTFRLSDGFINGGKTEGYKESVFGRMSFKKPEEFGRIVEEIDRAYRYVNKDIKAYFEKTSTDTGMLTELETIYEHKYYKFLHPENLLVKACLENRMGMIEKAREEFEEVTFRSDQLKEEYRKKIGWSNEKVNSALQNKKLGQMKK